MVESKKLDDMDNAWQRGFQAYMAEAFSDPRTSPPAPKAKDRSDTGPSVEGWSGTRSDGSSLAFAHLSTSVQMYSNHPGAAVEIEIRRAPETV